MAFTHKNTGDSFSAAEYNTLVDAVDANTTAITTRIPLDLGAMTSTQRDAIVSPTVGSRIFNTTTGMWEFYQDANWKWMPIGAPPIEWQRKYGFEYYREFANINGDGILSQITINSGTITGAGGASGSTEENANIGSLNTSTTTNGIAAYLSYSGGFTVGSGFTVYEARIYIPTLSNSTDRFFFQAGFFDVLNSNQTDAISFLYDEGGVNTGSAASGNWQIMTSSNSTRTFQTTSLAVAAATWYVLRIEVAADGSIVSFFVNGTQVGTAITTNIPIGVARAFGFGMLIAKNLGTTSRSVNPNYLWVRQKYSTTR
jgi:hypothetical protein